MYLIQALADGLLCFAQADVQPFLEAMIDDVYSLFLFTEELQDKAQKDGDHHYFRKISSVLAMVINIQDQLQYTSDEVYGALQQYKEEVPNPVAFATQFSGYTYSNSWEVSPDFPRLGDLPSPLSSTDSLLPSAPSSIASVLEELD